MIPRFSRRTALAALALACSATFVTTAIAQERHRHGYPPPYRTSHFVYDDRHHHGHYYPSVGYVVPVLPPGYMSVAFGRRHLFFHGGVWYEGGGGRYIVVRPPIGVVVPVLPPAYTVVTIGGVPYYYADEVYYAQAPGGYVVANPPPGPETIVATAPPAGAAPSPQASPSAPPYAPPPSPSGPVATAPAPAAPAVASAANVWYYCDSARTYYPYVATCPEAWRQVPATPPTPR